MRHIIPISGKDSLTTAIIQQALEPDLPYEFVFSDVGSELPETYVWMNKIERQTGWVIKRTGANLESYIHKWNMLPSRRRRYCTRVAKIEPLEAFYKDDDDVTVYYGLRADENRPGVKPFGEYVAKYPLIEQGITLRDVWRILAERDLLPPSYFWPALEARVRSLLGIQGDLIEALEPWERTMLFAGRSRSNCYFCFFQRLYELTWLLDTHPDLFWHMSELEKTIGVGFTDFTWLKGFYISEKIVNEKQQILDKRARQVCKIIRQRFKTGLLDDGFVLDNELAATSCGLLCGK